MIVIASLWAIWMRGCPQIELSADASVFFQQRYAGAASGEVNAGGESADASADDDRAFRSVFAHTRCHRGCRCGVTVGPDCMPDAACANADIVLPRSKAVGMIVFRACG